MAAYASLLSLMQIFHQLQHHPSPPISMDKKQVESLTEIVMFLQEFLEGYKSPYADGDEADPLEMHIADSVYAAEDIIESHIVHQIRPSVLVWYEALSDVIESMGLINESSALILETIVFQIRCLRKDKVIKDMDWIIAVKGELLQRQASSSADSSTSVDLLYESEVKVIEYMDLIRKEVMQIFALKDQLNRIYSESGIPRAPVFESLVKVIEGMDLIKKEVMEIVALEEERRVSTSSNLHKSLQKVIEDMDVIKKEVVALKDQQVSSFASSSTSSKESSLSMLNNTTMVGFDDVMLQLMEKLVYGELGRQVIPIVGMGGIGKTTLAEHVYAHQSISRHFDICVWVTISQQYDTKDLLREILSQANKQGSSQISKEDEIGLALHKCLSYRRYLIVLDDMWSIEAWEKLQRYFPDNSNGSRIMVTTRLSNLGSQLDTNYDLEMKFMDEISSWNMFCKIVFRGKSCPLELEKIGKKIVHSCKGLPLSIVAIGGLLETMEQTKECWESIRESMSSLVNLENDKHCLKILKLSYNHLPVYLKPCFLYLGMFEEDSKIRVSRVIKLWVSEGFLKPISGKSLETIAKEYLDELVNRNLIIIHKLGSTGNMKYCKIHDLLRDLCIKEAQKERFYDVVRPHSPQGTCSQRRVAILGSTSKEKVIDAMKSRPYARTCISDSEKVELLSYWKLLRTLRLRDEGRFPGHSLEKLYELVNLRLLVVRFHYFSQVLSSLNFLWSLQTLIVFSSEITINAPVEIWNMSQLRHVKAEDSMLLLPDPPSDNIVIMENLQSLKGILNLKCDEMMVRRIPNIKKLGLQYYGDGITGFREIESHGDHFCVQNIKLLQKLESLSCAFREPSRSDLFRKLTFPHSLKSLTLSMFVNKIEDVLDKVSTLPLLQKLKLRGGYFATRKWETVEDGFLSLKFLSLDIRTLECWTMESSHFPCLEHLHLRDMHHLKLPAEVGEIPTLKSVVLRECSISAAKSAKRVVEEQEELQGEDQLSFKVEVKISCSEDYTLLRSLATPNFKVV
ncbi:putative late blight resistance protein homolog R1B-16 [Salvia hispanica]|uniref:putative late blight resistance protein homolog R1B-16 n=1 Tax=Salvia hispanica TaxID=49212 RepID=UPI002009CBBA|nr:putative late blight resistance protein homolog R1B-16 [Salvia hispanica]